MMDHPLEGPSEPIAERIRVYLVDDHAILRSGLKALVDSQRDMAVVGEAEDGVAALSGVESLRPDVVVMDLSMPKLGGAETTERLRATFPDVKVLALTAYEERGYVQLLIAAGACGYLLKRAAPDELVRAIRAIAAGGMYLDPSIAAQVVARAAQPNPPVPRVAHLSDREAEVVKLIAEGHAMKEIAGKLEISTRTLETYRARAMDKLSLRTRAELVQYALLRGWLKNR
jgi:DNA-binding NarL/FixJ family response regulator